MKSLFCFKQHHIKNKRKKKKKRAKEQTVQLKSKQRGCQEQPSSSSKKGTALFSFSSSCCSDKRITVSQETLLPPSVNFHSSEQDLTATHYCPQFIHEETETRERDADSTITVFSKPPSYDPSEDMDVRPWTALAAQTQPVYLPLMSQWMASGQDPSAVACGLQLVCGGSEYSLQSPLSSPLTLIAGRGSSRAL